MARPSRPVNTSTVRHLDLAAMFSMLAMVGYPAMAKTKSGGPNAKDDVTTKANSRLVSTVKGHVVFTVIATLLTANVLRIALSLTVIDIQRPVIVSFLVQWTLLLYVYTVSYPRSARKMQQLWTSVRNFEEHHGLSLDAQRVNTTMKTVLVAFHTVILLVYCIAPPISVIRWPEFRVHLFPLHETEGVYLILAIVGGVCQIFINVYILMAWVVPLKILSYVIKTEFMDIAARMSDIFKVQDDHNVCKCSTTATTTVAGRMPSPGQDAKDSTAIVCEVGQKKGARLKNGTVAASSLASRTRAGATEKIVKAWTKNKETSSLHALDITDQDQDPDAISVTLTPSGNPLTDHATDHTSSDEPVTMETKFDLLCDRYEAVCLMADRLQALCEHLWPALITGGILCMCVVGFSYSRGDLPSGELIGTMGTMFMSFTYLLFVTGTGCSINDSSKACLPVLHSINKACLSVSLLHKIHLMVTRVVSGDIGFHAYGLFFICRHSLLMLAGTILTYMVVVVQFQMAGSQCQSPPANVSVL